MAEEIGDVSWTPLLEVYLKRTGERAHALSWMHGNAARRYSRRAIFIDLPVIAGSALIAFLSSGSSALFEGESRMSSIALGAGSLAVAILQSFNAYLAFSRKAEGHRVGALSWARLFRFITIELGLPRHERMGPKSLLKHVAETYDRLAETCPQCPPETIAEFKSRFSDARYEEVAKPPEVNGLERVVVYHEKKDSEKISTASLKAQSSNTTTQTEDSGFIPNDKITIRIPPDVRRHST